MEGSALALIMLFGGVISLILFLMALFRIEESNMTDGMKLGWVITILFIPIAGSFSALTIVKKQLVEPVE